MTFINTKNPTLTILKVDEETKEPLANAKFKIIRTEDETIKEALTDENGKIFLDNLEPGIYTIEETVAPHGYILEEKNHKDIELKAGDNKELIWTNKARPKLRIQKIDATTGEFLKNSEFRVEKVEDKTVSEYILENGEITLENLDEAIYKATEFMPPDGYILLTESKQIMTEWGKTKTLKFDNIRKPVVIFQKSNPLTGKGIPGATFTVAYEQLKGGTKVIGTFKTDANGKIIIPKGESGWYIFTEIMPAPGFSLPKTPVSRQFFEAGDNAYLAEFSKYYTAGTGEYASGYAPNDGTTVKPDEPTGGSTGNNTNAPSSLEVHSGSEYYVEGHDFNWPLNSIVLKKADANTGELLQGAAIELYRADEQVSGQPGTQIGRYVTDSSGVVVVVGLEPGYYVAKEVQPPPNYILAETSLQNGFLKADGTTVLEFTFRNFPYGNIAISKKNGTDGTPLADAVFKVTDAAGAAVGSSAGEFTTNAQGEIIIPNVKPGSYVITEVKAPDNFAINSTPKTIEVGTDGKVYTVSFDNYPYGAILITKINGLDGTPLAGAVYKVVDNAGKVVGNTTGEFTTDSRGEILIENVPPGSYVATEIKAPENFAINTTPKTVEVGIDGKTQKISFDNYPYGTLVLKKLDSDTKEPLANAKFKVTTAKGDVVGDGNGNFSTDEKGTIIIPNLPKGSYVVKEIKAPTHYILENETKTIDINYGKSYTLEFFNKKMSSAQIVKIDGQTKQPLKDAKFTVYKADGEIIGTYTTDGDGLIILPHLEPGWYKAVENKAPLGYILDEIPKDFEITGNQFVKLVFENQPKASLILKKFDLSDKKPLIGARFKISRKSGDVVGEFTSDANGLIQIDNLEPGWYSAVEVSPPVGYKLIEQAQDFEIKHTKTVTLDFPNEKLTSLIIKKVSEKDGSPLIGAKFTVQRQNGEHVGDFTTDSDGLINIPTLAPDFYIIREIKAPKGFLLDESPKTIEVKTNVPTIATFTNKKLTSLEIIKTSESGEPLNGAVFVVERQNGKRIGEYTTSEKGIISIPELQPDWYVIKETKAPRGYHLDEAPRTIEVKTEVPAVAKFVNKKLTALEIIKTSESGEPLNGAVFVVERQNGERIGEYTTSEKGIISIPELQPDWYVIKETKAPRGYHLDEAPRTIEVKTEVPAVAKFVNKKLTALEIIKTSESGEPLNGAVFVVERQNGERIGEFTTSEKGIISIPELQPDWYVIKETKAPSGYHLDESPRTIEVKTEVPAVAKFVNKKLTALEIIKTSESGEPLNGAVFVVERQNGERIGEFTTSEKGIISIPELQPDWYVIKEIKAPSGYHLDESPRTIEVKTEVPAVAKFINKKLTALEIIKTSESGEPLNGAVFVVERQNGERIGEFTTSEKGIISIPELQPDWYVVKETKAPSGYHLDEAPRTIEVKTEVPAVAKFINKKLTSLQIKKICGVTGKALPGARFTVEKQNGEKIYTNENGMEFTTDAQGFINIPTLSPDYYVIKETHAPEGFLIDETPKTVQVKTDSPTVVTFSNMPLNGLKIIKRNSENKQPIEGVLFSITRMNGEKVMEVSTGKDGTAYVPDLTPGHYVVTEIKAADGFIIDGSPKTIEIKTDGQSTILEVENSPNSGLLIVKTDEKGKPLAGVVFDVRKADGQRVTGSILDQNQPNTENNSPNKNTTLNGDISGCYTTDAQGRILINNLDSGEYHVVETKALDGYEIDSNVHAVTVTPGKQAVVKVINKEKAGLRILKIDSISKRPIFNVEFMLFDESGKVIGTYYSDNNGVVDFAGIITPGRYTIRETRAAEGYYRDDLPRTINFESGKYTELTWENIPNMGQIQITKKSANANEVNGLPSGTPLEGAIFEVYAHKSGNLVDRFVSESNGIAVSKPLPLGRYKIKEVQAPKFYKLNQKELDIEIEFATQIIKLEFENESANTGVAIKKTGVIEASPGSTIKYDIVNVQNSSSVPITDFYWRDTLPTDAVRINKIVTGTYSLSVKYKITATTNKGNTIIIADNLSSLTNNVVDCSNASLGLFNDEFVTSFTLYFGNVPAGFRNVETPQVYVNVLKTLPNGYQYANKVDVGGKYQGEWIISNSTWLTTIYNPTANKLPKTGW